MKDEKNITGESSQPSATEARKKPRYPFWKRLLIFLLGLFIGILACLGGLVGGGFWAYKNVSVEKLQEMGVPVELPEALQGEGEVNISKYTLEDILSDVMYYTNEQHADELTLANFKQKYGLNLFSDLEESLPPKFMTLKLSSLTGDNAMDTILACVDFDYVFSMMEEGTVPKALADSLGDKTLADLMNGDPMELLSDVVLGDLAGYTKTGKTWKDADGVAASALIGGVLDYSVGDLTSGKLDLAAITDGLFLGDLMEYELVDGVYYDHGAPVTGVNKTLAGVALSELLDGDLDVAGIFKDDKLGDLMGYELVGGVYCNKGEPLTGINKTLAEVSISELVNGDCDVEELMGDEYVGTLMGYTHEKNDWYQNGTKVSGMYNSLANVRLREIFDGSITVDGIIGDVYMGEIMGFEVEMYKADGKTPDTWRDGSGNPVTGINEQVANMRAGALTGGEIDFKGAFGEQKVGELQGYTYAGGTWYRDSTKKEKLGALDSAIANLVVGDMIDGKIDLGDAFRDEKVGNLQNYTFASGRWYKDEKKTKPLGAMESMIAGWSLGDLMNGNVDYTSEVGTLTVADVLDYQKIGGKWYKGSAPITGVMAYLADARVTDLSSRVDGMKVADALGLEKRDGKWQSGGKPVSGLVGAIADCGVSTLDARMDTITLAEVFDGTDSGFFRLIGGETRLSKMGDRLNEVFDTKNGATIGDFMDAGIISGITTEQDAKLKQYIGNDWRDTTMTGFVDQLIHVIATLP